METGTPEGTRTPYLLLRRQLLYPDELLARINGAGDENRTRIPSLEGWCPDHCATPAFELPIVTGKSAFVKRFFLFEQKFFIRKIFSGMSERRTPPAEAGEASTS